MMSLPNNRTAARTSTHSNKKNGSIESVIEPRHLLFTSVALVNAF